ncbi:5-hydroxytryptamine receptor 2B-like [Melanaphis sacchari]|uniref:5-hydroxytryptamine receptor 2B-like n=1 Tax=Melanaphis sacchari TaxID=742174 RepID=UPI000DC1573B|nr:5-hydroxytryptamine receptor 2B-like [Melanaphis sacchari]
MFGMFEFEVFDLEWVLINFPRTCFELSHEVEAASPRWTRRTRTVYTSNSGRGGVADGVAVVIGNDTAAGPTSPLLQTATPPTPPLIVGQTNVTGGGGSGGGGGGGGEGPLYDGYWWWALLAVFLVLATAAGNILVCLAIAWERRLQNVTNYFLMSLAVTDLMVAVLVMPVGILTLVKGVFPLAPVYCLAWICLDVLFCTASIMHLCTISVDRYLSLRYPMKFGRNKTRRRVILKIVFVWLLSIAMSLPLSLMYSKDFNSVLVNGSCQIPDPLYKLIGSIVSFYIPLGVMILTYTLTVRHLAAKRQNLQTGFTHNSNQNNTRRSWRRMLRRNYRRTRSDETDVRSAIGEELTGVMASSIDGGGRKQKGRSDSTAGPSAMKTGTGNGAPSSGSQSTAAAEDDSGAADSVDNSPRFGHHHNHHHRHHHRAVTPNTSCRSTPRPFRHNPSVGSTDTEMTSLDARELWLPDTEPTPSTMSALHQFGAEMLRLSRGLEKVASPDSKPTSPDTSRSVFIRRTIVVIT